VEECDARIKAARELLDGPLTQWLVKLYNVGEYYMAVTKH
jgi:hypothetical protein